MQGLSKVGVRIPDLFDGKGEAITPTPREEIADRNALRLWRDAAILADSPASCYLAGRAITTSSPFPSNRSGIRTPTLPRPCITASLVQPAKQ